MSYAKETPLSTSKTNYQMDIKRKYIFLVFFNNNLDSGGWFIASKNGGKQEISLDQLEQMLTPQFVVKEIALALEELQKQAELHGYKLVKEERQIKVGDFGKFLDDGEDGCVYGFVAEKTVFGFRDKFHDTSWNNFAHLTDEEKQQIQENW